MKLLRYGAAGAEKPGCLDSAGKIRDLSQHIPDIAGEVLSPEGLNFLRGLSLENLPLISDKVRLGPCLDRIGKIICIGLNYADHAAETGSKLPTEPVAFAKFTSAICGPTDTIIIPRDSAQTDWEVELGVVIGKKTKRVSEADALSHVAGYCVINDISERNYQIERGGGQWTKGKSCDTFAPMGPWLVTADEVPDPQKLSLWLDMDGTRYQDGNSKDMIFGVAYLISYLSQFFTLHPGDVISTGTPAGVGKGQKPNPIYLKPGQKLHFGISGLGEQEHVMAAEAVIPAQKLSFH